jgi:hypothetical protein
MSKTGAYTVSVGAKDSILYAETWVGGTKVDSTVKKGSTVEFRVVYEIKGSGGTYKLCIQRSGGAYVCSGSYSRVPGTYYLSWSWTVDYAPGSYTIKVDLYNDGTIVDSKAFPHTVVS